MINININTMLGITLDAKHPFILEDDKKDRLSVMDRIKLVEDQTILFQILITKLRKEPINAEILKDKSNHPIAAKANELFGKALSKSLELANQDLPTSIEYQKELADQLDKHVNEILNNLKDSYYKTQSRQSRNTRTISAALMPKAHEIFKQEEEEADSTSSSENDQADLPTSPRLSQPVIISAPRLEHEDDHIIKKIKGLTNQEIEYAFNLIIRNINTKHPKFSNRGEIGRKRRQSIEKEFKSMRLPLISQEQIRRKLKDIHSKDLNAHTIGLDIDRQLEYISLTNGSNKELSFDSFLDAVNEDDVFSVKCDDFKKLLTEIADYISEYGSKPIVAEWELITSAAKKSTLDNGTFPQCCERLLQIAETKSKKDLVWSAVWGVLQSITQNTYMVPLMAARGVYPEPKENTTLAVGAKIHFSMNSQDGTITLTTEGSLWLFPTWESVPNAEDRVSGSLGKITATNVLTTNIRTLPKWTSSVMFTLEVDPEAETKVIESKIKKPLRMAGILD